MIDGLISCPCSFTIRKHCDCMVQEPQQHCIVCINSSIYVYPFASCFYALGSATLASYKPNLTQNSHCIVTGKSPVTAELLPWKILSLFEVIWMEIWSGCHGAKFAAQLSSSWLCGVSLFLLLDIAHRALRADNSVQSTVLFPYNTYCGCYPILLLLVQQTVPVHVQGTDTCTGEWYWSLVGFHTVSL